MYCDDGNNNAACYWDGGACCGCNVLDYYCKECECLDPDYVDDCVTTPKPNNTTPNPNGKY